MYPEELIAPMRTELSAVGFEEFRTAEQVAAHLGPNHKGTSFVVVNAVCGCAAGAARPGVRMALEQAGKKPTTLATVFAGNDLMLSLKYVSWYCLTLPPLQQWPYLKMANSYTLSKDTTSKEEMPK